MKNVDLNALRQQYAKQTGHSPASQPTRPPARPAVRPASKGARYSIWPDVRTYFLGLGPLTVIWLLTPVVGSFASLLSPQIRSIVFFQTETGSTTGDGPWTLYRWLLIVLAVAWFLSLIVRLALGPHATPRARLVNGFSSTGMILGLGVVVVQVIQNWQSPMTWACVPLGFILGQILHAFWEW